MYEVLSCSVSIFTPVSVGCGFCTGYRLTVCIFQLLQHLPESLGGPPMVETMEELLTVQEVATRLRVNEATVRRWIKNGALDAIKLPHRGKREIYRVRRSTLSSVLKDLNASNT